MAGILYALLLCLTAIFYFAAVYYVPNIDNPDNWLFAAMLALCYYYNIKGFGCYRNHRIVLDGEKIEVISAWGRRCYYQKSDIALIYSKSGGSKIVALNANNKKLFKFSTNLVNADKLYYALTGQQEKIRKY